MWDSSKTICEHLLQKSFIDKYLIWTKNDETSVNAYGNTKQARAQGNIEQARAEHNDDTGVVHDSHGGECLDAEGLLHRVCA
jgi:hypothetical protein